MRRLLRGCYAVEAVSLVACVFSVGVFYSNYFWLLDYDIGSMFLVSLLTYAYRRQTLSACELDVPSYCDGITALALVDCPGAGAV